MSCHECQSERLFEASVSKRRPTGGSGAWLAALHGLRSSRARVHKPTASKLRINRSALGESSLKHLQVIRGVRASERSYCNYICWRERPASLGVVLDPVEDSLRFSTYCSLTMIVLIGK